jgi:single-stranded DNA-binding protein
MLNSLLIEGRIFGEVETLQTSKGTPKTRFSITSDHYIDQEKQTIVVGVVAYGKLAAKLEGLTDGLGIRIVGRLGEERDQIAGGYTHMRTIIIAEHVEFKPA